MTAIKSMVLLALVMLTGCGSPRAASTTTPVLGRQMVATRLETRLQTDPNHALCEQVASAFGQGDQNALGPLWNYAAFIDRIAQHGGVDDATLARLRASPPASFSQLAFPSGSQFRCLGTRVYRGESYVALRQWTATRYDYVLLRLSGDNQLPIDDYEIVSSGMLHSELQARGLSAGRAQWNAVLGRMLEQSYQGDFAGIIAAYQAFPQSVQDSPDAFFHYLNAVFSSEQTGSALYRDAVSRLEVVMVGREYSLAYWRLIDAQRRGDAAAADQSVARLVELLDDYELMQ